MVECGPLTRLEGPRKSWRIWRKRRIWRKWRFCRNLVKAVDEMLRANILTRLVGPRKRPNFVKAVDETLQANILTRLEGPWKSWRIWRKRRICQKWQL